jgi:prolyl 4-hydroxylase
VGLIPNVGIEELQVGRTKEGEHHTLHWDYYIDPEPDSSGKVCNRVSSFFVYLSDVEKGGETYFPFLQPQTQYMDTRKFKRPEEDDGLGLMIRPLRGNAVFWMNMHNNGSVDERSMHAGMEVKNGTKYGLNILVDQCN